MKNKLISVKLLHHHQLITMQYKIMYDKEIADVPKVPLGQDHITDCQLKIK